jgi:hypothetical protein
MRFASFPKFALLVAPAVVFVVTLAGCGSNNNMTLTQGNWSVAATSTAVLAPIHQLGNSKRLSPNVSNVSFYAGGNLTQTGTNVAGTMYIYGSLCFDSSSRIAFTGTVNGTKVTLTSASVNGQVITVTATGTSTSATSALTGTYTVTGGCDDGDSGTLTASAVAPITGTWTGTLTNCTDGPLGCVPATISIDLTEATTASSDGTFALTGPVTYTTSSCSSNGTISAGSIAGPYVHLNDTPNDTGSFDYSFAFLDSTSAPANMTGTYQVSGGNCDGAQATLTLTKQ